MLNSKYHIEKLYSRLFQGSRMISWTHHITSLLTFVVK